MNYSLTILLFPRCLQTPKPLGTSKDFGIHFILSPKVLVLGYVWLCYWVTFTFQILGEIENMPEATLNEPLSHHFWEKLYTFRF